MKSNALAWLRTPEAAKLSKLLAGLTAAVVVVGVVIPLIWPQSLRLVGLGKRADPTEAKPEEPDASDGLVNLSARHAQVAGLVIGRATTQPLQETHTVPGKVTYHASRQLDLKAPVECVVKKVLVEVGSEIQQGDKLAILTSSEIGLARDHLSKCADDLHLALHDLDWNRRIHDNLQDLLALLKQSPDLALVESRFEGKVLGDYRDKVLSAYSKLVLANLTSTSTLPLQEQGVLSGRLFQERRSAKEVQQAQFQSVCETSKFESLHQREHAQAAADQAERLFEVSRDKLKSLLGPYSDEALPTAGQSISEFGVRSPLAGRVEERFVVEAARIAAGQPLFSLANTDVLWVSVEIHERNWNALSLVEGRDLEVRSPALPGGKFNVRVRYVGSKVSEETRSVPLVAELDNSQHLFKPGMFVWVSVPVQAPRDALVVRPAAVMHHEGQALVFVPEGAGSYRRVNVTTGLENSDWIEIHSGLAAGQAVVEQGAALLKSELLLPTFEE